MTESTRAPAVRGKTIRFRWTEGPTKGTTHEHVFHEDGGVEWRDVVASKAAAPAEAPRRAESPERPAYAAIQVAEDAYVVSYLAASGYTLTVVLNFRNQQLVGFASSAKEWYPVRGTFEVVQ
jgi:hypothetical protein